MPYNIAAIDVHKKVLVAVIADMEQQELQFQWSRFGTAASELKMWAEWLAEQQVQEVVRESTAQYWRPVWLELEGRLKLHLAQAQSNKAPRDVRAISGMPSDFCVALYPPSCFSAMCPTPSSAVGAA